MMRREFLVGASGLAGLAFQDQGHKDRPKEMRAATSHQFEYIINGTFEPENIERVVEDLASHNYNAVQVCVRAPGIHFYPSDIAPVHPYCRNYDFLGEFVTRAHRAGLRIYSYYPVFLEGDLGAPEASGEATPAERRLGGILAKHPEWASLGGKNGALRADNWGCPSNDGYVDYVIRAIKEQVSRYDLDGIIWDFIRFRFPCYCEHCRRKFRLFSGGESLNTRWISGPEVDFRCHIMLDNLKMFNAAVRGAKPAMKIGAYVFPQRRQAIATVFQDWLEFSLHCDFLQPMYYGDIPQERFREVLYTDAQLARCPLVLGLLPSLDPKVKRGQEDQLCEDIETARQAGYKGFFMLSYEPLFGWPRGGYSSAYWHTPHPKGAARRISDRVLSQRAAPLF